MENAKIRPLVESKPLNRLPKNCHSWLRPGVDPYAKFHANRFTGGFWANGWII